jgi:hypothetical protein
VRAGTGKVPSASRRVLSLPPQFSQALNLWGKALPSRSGCLFSGAAMLLGALSLAAIAAVAYAALLILQEYPYFDFAQTVRTHPALDSGSNLDGISYELLRAFHSGLDAGYYFGIAIWRCSTVLLLLALFVGFSASKAARPASRFAPALWAASLLATGLAATAVARYSHRFIQQPQGHFDVRQTQLIVARAIVVERVLPWALFAAGVFLVALSLGLLLALKRLCFAPR